MDDTPQTGVRWFHLTPGRYVLALLAVEVLLWLSERFGWLAWHKGYAVLTAVASVGVAMLLMLLWFGVAVVFRRRFQFSLRSLLLLVVVVALPFSWLAVEMKKARKQDEALKGLFVVYDWQVSAPGVLRQNALQPGPELLRKLLGNDFFQDAFYTKTLNDNEIERVKGLFRLRELSLNSSKITNVGLNCLPALSHLEYLSARQADIDDLGMAHLAGLFELRELDLADTKITDAGLQHLSNLTKLQRLNLRGTAITDVGLRHLQALPQLHELDLGDQYFRGWFNGESQGSKPPNATITDAGLDKLKGLSALQKLNLVYCKKITDAGVARLQQALPNCKITR